MPQIDSSSTGMLSIEMLGPLVTIACASYAALDTALLTKANQWMPKIIDGIIAAASVVVSMTLIHTLDDILPFKLLDSKMMTSAVVFCTNPNPPSPHAAIACSAISFVAGVFIHFAGLGLPSDAVAVSVHLLFAKLSGCNFSPAVGLTAVVGKATWQNGSWSEPLHYLFATWFAGHALLYAFAHAIAVPRRAARLYLTQRQWKDSMQDFIGGDGDGDEGAEGAEVEPLEPLASTASALEQSAKLRTLFNTYDTSGNGAIDPTEFRVALRALLHVDVPLCDCEATVRSFDADGNGTLCFREFCEAICGINWWRHTAQRKRASLRALVKFSKSSAELKGKNL